MKIQKTILAMTGIFLLVIIALFLPGILNDITDRNEVSKVEISEDETRYEISKVVQKTTNDKLKTLAEVFEKKREAQVLSVDFKANLKKVQEIEDKISAEYEKWKSLIKNLIEFKKLDLDIEGTLYHDGIALYTIYNTNISYYVCDAVVASDTTGDKYRVRLYVDSDNFKIYLLQVLCDPISDWVKSYWNEGGSEKEWLNISEEKMKQYLVEYYEIENVTNVKSTYDFSWFGMYLNNRVLWNIREWNNIFTDANGSYSGESKEYFGIQIGIVEFEVFTYEDNQLEYAYY